MNQTLLSIAESWCVQNSRVNSTESLLDWVRQRNETVAVSIRKNRLEDSEFWFYDRTEGCIRNQNRSFFSITGFAQTRPDGTQTYQPILLQQEIGFLGILCREIDGVMHFLMQAKIEPGNVNQIQISPTIQATKSNFTRKHGGKQPPYLEYFTHAERYEIVVDQIQSEQSSRFYHKRNRNLILRVEEEIPVLPSHRWMTLGQIKRLMREPNLVNMDTRTVLSCIPFCKLRLPLQELDSLAAAFSDRALFRSVFCGAEENLLPPVTHAVNDYKMFAEPATRFLPLHELPGWEMQPERIVCTAGAPFQVVYCDIAIEGREVTHWTQPLFEATGIATFGLLCCEKNHILHFLVKVMPESGCFDGAELGPTVQQEAGAPPKTDAVSDFFQRCVAENHGVIFDQLLSEEGGRFYHEQNRNLLIRVAESTLPPLPQGYFLLDYRTLNELVQVNNTLNIQLRNLLSLLEA